MTMTALTLTGKPTLSYPISGGNQTGYSGQIPAQTGSVTIGGTFVSNKYVSISVNGSEVSRVFIPSLGSVSFSVPSTVNYPSTFRISIVS